LASIRTLGYHPHAGARSLASNRANIIALVLPLRAGMQVPVLMQFASAVVTTARRHDHDVLLVTADEGAAGLRRIAASALVDGLILMDVEMRDTRVPLLRELDRPSVLIGFPAQAEGLTCVDLDFFRAGEECVKHLAELGHREIALLGPPRAVYKRGTGFAQRTMAGFANAAKRLGVSGTVVPCEETTEGVRRQVSQLLTDHPSLTGLVVHNEAAVGQVLDVMRELGRSVPGDMSVVAICPDEFAERATPPLDSVLIPAEEVGMRAVDLLMRKLDGDPVPDSSLLAPRLTTRASCARVTGRRAEATLAVASTLASHRSGGPR
jgi:DNA-binding LacI/PurR family transcriptional regulator